MRLDLHCHSWHSYDNHLDPKELVQRARSLGLDGVCFTEHHSVDASYPVTRMPLPDDFLVLRGVEVSTDCGHLLVYGVTDDSWNRWGRNNFLSLTEVVRRVHHLGAICVAAHPFRGWESLGERLYTIDGFDAIETHNGVNDFRQNDPAIQAARKLALPSIGGSDCHTVDQVGRMFTEFVNLIRNMDDLIREIRAGNCFGREGA